MPDATTLVLRAGAHVRVMARSQGALHTTGQAGPSHVERWLARTPRGKGHLLFPMPRRADSPPFTASNMHEGSNSATRQNVPS